MKECECETLRLISFFGIISSVMVIILAAIPYL